MLTHTKLNSNIANTTPRRAFLRGLASAGTVGAVASVAGCIDLGVDDETVVGEPFPTLEFLVPTAGADSQQNECGHWVIDNMEEIGFDIQIQELQFEQHVTRLAIEHDYDVSIQSFGGTPDRIDPNVFLMDMHHSDFAVSGGRNAPGYINPEYDEIVEAQAQAVDEEQRRELVFECQEILADDQPRCWIAHPGGVHPYNSDRLLTVRSPLGEGLNSFWNFLELEPASGIDTVVGGFSSEITSLNPLQDLSTRDRQMIRLLYDQLYRFDEVGNPTPWLATTEPEITDEGTTVTVPLRDDHQFHDGEPVTVSDVQYSFDLFAEHSPTYRAHLEGIEEIDTGADEITFHLDGPDATFYRNVLSQIYIFPEHIWREIDNPTESEDPVRIGSGPFLFEGWSRGVELQLRRNEDHFQPPVVERLIRVPGSEEVIMDQLEAGEIDFVGEVPTPTVRNRMDRDETISSASWEAVGHVMLEYNMRRSYMDDVHIRRAISHCVPKEAFVEDIRGGMGTVAQSPISNAVETWHNPDVRAFTEDLEAAKAELEAGGYVWDGDGRLHFPAEE